MAAGLKSTNTVVWNDRKVQKFLRELEKNRKKMSDKEKGFVGLLMAHIYKNINQHFEQEKGPSGKWRAWSEAYASHMRKSNKGANKILQDEGTLRQGLKKTNWRKVKEGFEVFNNVPYARTHDEGDRSRNIPKRQFMWLDKETQLQMTREVLMFLKGKK